MTQPPIHARFGLQMGIAITLYRGLIERLLAPHDLTWPQFSLLAHLACRSGPERISDIAVAVELTQPAVTKVVQKFLGQGLVEVVRDDRDARNRPIRITPVGMTRLTAMQRSFGPVFDQLLDGWSADDLERLIADLTRLTGRLDAMRKSGQ